MRISSTLVLAALALAGCHRGDSSKDSVRQAVVEYLGGHGFNVSAMNIDVTAVNVSADRGEANVSIATKTAPGVPAMSIVYLIEQRGAKWVVTGRKQTGGMPHGHAAMPGGAVNPHGAMPPGGMANPHGAMPAPQDLPPVDKTK